MNNLIWIAGSVFSLPIFVFLGWLLSGALRTAEQARLQGKAAPRGSARRRIESNPNIVCGFPMHQQARSEAPLY